MILLVIGWIGFVFLITVIVGFIVMDISERREQKKHLNASVRELQSDMFRVKSKLKIK